MADVHGPLRIGLVGASRVATYAIIAPARESADAAITRVAARDVGRARAYAAEHGIAGVAESYAALFADPEIDLVYLGTPPALHREQACAALAAGKAVLCEKPFARYAAEARDMLAAARIAGRPLLEAMHTRHHALFARVREIVASGEIGRLVRMDAWFDAPIARTAAEFRWSGALGGGALMDLGIYPLSLVRGLAGAEPAVAAAEMTMTGDVDASFRAELRFPGEVTATIASSMVSDRRGAGLEAIGTTGRVTVENPVVPQLGHAIRVTGMSGGERVETAAAPSTYAAQLAAVVATVRDGSAWPLPPDDPLASMVAIDAIRSAARR